MHLAYRRPKVINQCPKQIEDDRLKFHLLVAARQNLYFAALIFGPFGVSSISYPACLTCARRASASFHCFALRAFSRFSTSAKISSGTISSVGCHSANRSPNTRSNCNSVAFLVERGKSSFTTSHTTARARGMFKSSLICSLNLLMYVGSASPDSPQSCEVVRKRCN